jgi:membrane-bound serine protease (ClpP class)
MRRVMGGTFVLVLCLAAAAGLAAVPAKPAAEAGEARPMRKGQWLRVPLPLDNATVSRVTQSLQHAITAAQKVRPVFVLEFDPPAGGPEAGRGTQFEDAHRLARFLTSGELNAATTVAYVPKSLRGHAVLAVLACDQIVMGPAATVGDAGGDEKTVSRTELAAYEEISRSRHTVPVDVALGLLDRSRQVIRAVTETSTEYVTAEGLAALSKEHRIVSQEQIKPAGEPWQFSGSEGRKWGLVGFLAEDRREVIRGLELSSDVLQGSPSGDGTWHAVRVELKGPVTADKTGQIQRLIEDEVRGGANFVCLWLETPGGSPLDSKQLADYLADLDPGTVRTVAYIPTEARADAAVIAMACDQVVMHPRAILGGPGAYQMSDEEVARFRQSMRDTVARQKMRPWSLWAAMIDPHLPVFCSTRLGQVEYYSDEERESQQPHRNQGEKGPPWVKGEAVTTPGHVLQLRGPQAAELGLATVVENFAQFKQRYGLENDPALVSPGWADRLVDFLRAPEIAVLLLIIGGLGLYVELHAPGIGIGGFIATVGFALFFWSRYLEGTAGWLQVTLFLTGLACLLLEIFVLPGFVIFGLGGGILILLSLVMASQTWFVPRNEYQVAQLQRSFLTLGAAAGGMMVAVLVLRRWLPHTPVFRHVFLLPPAEEEADRISRREMLVDLDNLLGATGVTATPLAPGGKARFGSHLVDVLSGGDFVPPGTPVIVVEVHGNRVLVAAAKGD